MENEITIKELAELKNVHEGTIRNTIKSLYPNKLKNGVRTLLNQKECSEILLNLYKNPYLGESSEVETNYMKFEKLKDVFDNNDNDLILSLALIKANTILKEKTKALENAKPAIEFYDNYADVKNNIDFKSAAKILGTGRNRLFKLLRESNVLMGDNVPYQNYIEIGYFETKLKVIPNGNQVTITLITPKGFDWIQDKYFRIGIAQ